MMKYLLLFILLFSSASSWAKEENVVNVYNWADYIPQNIINQFEKETGIKVNYSEFENDETLYTKIKVTQGRDYDVIAPSNYLLERLANEGLLHQLDRQQLPNFRHLDPFFLNRDYDLHNSYSVPYLWTTTGIVVNKKYINPKEVTSWRDLWKPTFKHQLLILDEWREVISTVMIMLGHSASSTNTDEIKQAYLKLVDLYPNIKLFNTIAISNLLIDEDVTIGMSWAGAAYVATLENPNLVYIYPKEGFIIGLDCFAIPKNAKHVKNAYQFINFILRPGIAAQLVAKYGYGTPNRTAKMLLPKALRENYIIFPDAKTLQRGYFQRDVGDKNQVYERYWEKLKIH